MQRRAAWLRQDMHGVGFVSVTRTAEEARIVGHETTAAGGVHFEIVLDRSGKTRTVDIESMDRSGDHRLQLEMTGGMWLANGARMPHLDGCVDVDLLCVPVTNSLPIWRFGLADGEQAEIRAVWVGLPEPELEVIDQVYTHMGAQPDGSVGYRYHVPGSEGSTWMTVDEDGLVIDYEGFATRIRDLA